MFESINKSVLSWNPDKKLFSIGVDNAYNYVLVRMIKDWLSEKAIVAFRWKVVPHPMYCILNLIVLDGLKVIDGGLISESEEVASTSGDSDLENKNLIMQWL